MPFISKGLKRDLLRVYSERDLEIKGDYLRQMKEIEKLTEDEKWVVEKGKSGVLPDRVAKEQLAEIGNNITQAKLKLTDTHTDELGISTLVVVAVNFINNLEFTWVDASPKAKIKLQKIVFPQGVKYNYPGFSYSKISPIFEAINTFGTPQTTLVTPHGFEPWFTG